MGSPVGIIYLLHFDRPYQHARRYTGWTVDLDPRLADHATGRGARLLAVITDAGIGWSLARMWEGTRAVERALKRQRSASRRCPMCGVRPSRRTSRPAPDDAPGRRASELVSAEAFARYALRPFGAG